MSSVEGDPYHGSVDWFPGHVYQAIHLYLGGLSLQLAPLSIPGRPRETASDYPCPPIEARLILSPHTGQHGAD